ncbi:MAG: dTMP kinase [Acidobacteria bacterium]|nr:dTMP kinase [Acidobacteriota bacterium]
MRGFFITLEGLDGCGKSTQLERLAAALSQRGLAVLATRQPGGTEIGTSIRALMIQQHSRLSPVAEVLLMMADRAQHVSDIIKPNLEAGRIVISDRYIDSSVAFQGYGRGLEITAVEALNDLATGGLLPDLTILFELNREAAQARLATRTEKQLTDSAPMTGFDDEQHDFHQRVQQGYWQLAARHPDRIHCVDADGSVNEVHQRVMALVLERLQELGVRS